MREGHLPTVASINWAIHRRWYSRGPSQQPCRSAGLSGIVRDGQTGLLVRPGDANALGVALLRVLSERGFAESLGRAGHELAMAEFSETKMVDRFEQFYRSLCSQELVA